MNKKGAERMSNKLIFLTFMLVISGFITFALFNFVNNSLNDTTFWKNYYAKDLAMTTDILLAARGDADISYDFLKAEKLLVLKVSDEKFIITDYNPKIKDEKALQTTFRYAKDLLSPIYASPNSWKPVNLKTKLFKIIKTENNLEFTSEYLKKESCPNIETTANPEETNILVKSDKDSITTVIKTGLEGSNFLITDNKFESEIHLSISVEEGDENIISYHYTGNYERMEKLACIIQNNLVKRFPGRFTGSELKKMSEDDKSSLGHPDNGLKIYLGNTNNDLAMEITKGVMNYYG